MGSFKQRLYHLYKILRRSFLRAPLYQFQEIYFSCRYALMGKPQISSEDIQNVENNVTFIYKSFNRQNKASKLYRCIKRYYPKARIIIADDSTEPLDISGLSENDHIIHLPFNTGLSRGLSLALDEVKTPFVMRMDDDELLTPASNIHKELKYLQDHRIVDLVGIQPSHRSPEKRANRFAAVSMGKSLVVAAGTNIDGLKVVYKTANIFVARTESLRKVGYDPRIRMIDHHEFFYRAAGQIVCVQDPHAYIMHCHNLFEGKEYYQYRYNYRDDMIYIHRKHGANYMQGYGR